MANKKKINMIYLKTIFSSAHEVPYLKLNLRESWNQVDAFIICEYNFTHTGEPRPLIFKNFETQFTPEERKKIIYIGADLTPYIKSALHNSSLAHENERLMRGYFVKEINLANSDIVFSVDADEILFAHQYQPILERFGIFTRAQKLQLHQFFYKINYLWENNIFIAPTAACASYYKHRYPGQWRYDGRLYPHIAGVHFSWCLSVDDMIKKLHRYAHQSDYAPLANADVLEDAIKNKKYPFDPKVDFKIKVLNPDIDKQYYPAAMYAIMDRFKDFIEPSQI